MSDKEHLVSTLEQADLNEPLAGAIESVIEGGHPSTRLVQAIQRYTRSSNLDNRHAALSALVNYGGGGIDLCYDIIGLLVAGFAHDDDDVKFGAIGLLSLACRSNGSAYRSWINSWATLALETPFCY